MSRFIPVEPEKWAEMVKAWSENADLKAQIERMTDCKAQADRFKAEVERLKADNEQLQARCDFLEGKGL
jgi:hypothetical protein